MTYDPLTAGIISGGIGLLGTIFSNNESDRRADKQMDFQQRNSDSAHSREVLDLKKAGLNPILSALGAGASSPTGAAGAVQDIAPGISKGMDTAIAVKGQNKQIQAQDAGINNVNADTKNKTIQSTVLANEAVSSALDIKQKGLSNKLMEQTLPHAIKKAKSEGDYSEINQIMGIINSGANSAGSLMNLGNFLPKGAKLPDKIKPKFEPTIKPQFPISKP